METATATLEKPVQKPQIPARPKFAMAEPKFTPPRIVLNAVEGWGKTTAIAYAPKPAIIMAGDETGYDTLLGKGLVPAIQKTSVSKWQDLLNLLSDIEASSDLPFRTLGFDALNGFEKMCHTFVCARDYQNEWGDKGFGSYQKGYDTAINDWIGFLSRLERIRNKGIMIVIAGHVQIRPYKNPLGADFDRFVSDVHQKTWGITAKWADAVLFGNFITVTDEDKKTKRSKGIGGSDRIIYTERRDAFDAKNRYAMPAEIEIPDDPTKIFSTIWEHIKPTK